MCCLQMCLNVFDLSNVSFFILHSKKQTVQINLHHFICPSAEYINKLLYDTHLFTACLEV